MNDKDIRSGVIAALKAVAPEVDEGELAADQPLRQQVDLDSMDWLNVIIAFHQRLGVEIPESDYARLTTLNAIVAYLAARLP